MACRIGITTNPEARRRYWESQHPVGFGWEILRWCSSKSEAQGWETHFAALYGCEAHPGGDGLEFDDWCVYRFSYYY